GDSPGASAQPLSSDQRRRRDRRLSRGAGPRPLGPRGRGARRRAREAVLRRAATGAPSGPPGAGVLVRRIAAALGAVRRQLGDPARPEQDRPLAARSAAAARPHRRAGDRRRADLVALARRPGVRAATDARLRVTPRLLAVLAGAAPGARDPPHGRRESARTTV